MKDNDLEYIPHEDESFKGFQRGEILQIRMTHPNGTESIINCKNCPEFSIGKSGVFLVPTTKRINNLNNLTWNRN